MKTNYIMLGLCLAISACAQAQSEPTPAEHVFDVIASPKLFTSNWKQAMQQLAPWCKPSTRPEREQLKRGNVECGEKVKTDSFAMSPEMGGNIELVQASFIGAANCAYVKKILTRNFGKPSTVKGECSMTWNIKPASKGGPQRYASFEASTVDDMLDFTIGVEQGP
ncbi:hypothetical protein [Duganella sp. S19_KUP01_CR8]|uniref:hypothetical protein n=1 Tax=Duganella sp. S19_KUP01_CR8 TaxID=3025502 RepID=UPI002FCDD331